MNLGEKVRFIRKSDELNQKELAQTEIEEFIY